MPIDYISLTKINSKSIMMYTWLRHANQLQKPERKFKFHQKTAKEESIAAKSQKNDEQNL